MFAPDLSLYADQLESRGAMESDGRLVVAGDAGDDRMESVGRGQGQELGQERPPDALSPLVPVDIHGVLGRGGIA